MEITQIALFSLFALGVFIGVMIWEIKDNLKTIIAYQKDILGELVDAASERGVVEDSSENDPESPH